MRRRYSHVYRIRPYGGLSPIVRDGQTDWTFSHSGVEVPSLIEDSGSTSLTLDPSAGQEAVADGATTSEAFVDSGQDALGDSGPNSFSLSPGTPIDFPTHRPRLVTLGGHRAARGRAFFHQETLSYTASDTQFGSTEATFSHSGIEAISDSASTSELWIHSGLESIPQGGTSAWVMTNAGVEVLSEPGSITVFFTPTGNTSGSDSGISTMVFTHTGVGVNSLITDSGVTLAVFNFTGQGAIVIEGDSGTNVMTFGHSGFDQVFSPPSMRLVRDFGTPVRLRPMLRGRR